jgi:hypothetical protein
VPFAFLVQSLMIIWYSIAGDPAAGIEERRRRCPWYPAKATPSPADMHTALRDALPTVHISGISPGRDDSQKNIPEVVTSEAIAA